MVAHQISLAQIERKAWMSYFDDGLLDIFLGLVLLIVGVSDLLGDSLGSRLWVYAVYALLVGMACLGYWAGKRFMTVPRLGRVVFGPARQARRRKTAIILVVQIIVGMLLTGMLAAALLRVPLGGAPFSRSTLLAITVGLWAMIGVSLIAYFLDYTRGYLIATMYGIGFGGVELLGNPVTLFVAGAVTVALGTFVLIRFLRKHPAQAHDPRMKEAADAE
jgi:hypothetical protein